jgi:hypothetical protein
MRHELNGSDLAQTLRALDNVQQAGGLNWMKRQANGLISKILTSTQNVRTYRIVS